MDTFYTVYFCFAFTEMLPSQLGTVVQLKSYQSREQKYYFLMSLEPYFFSYVPQWLSSTSMAFLIFHLNISFHAIPFIERVCTQLSPYLYSGMSELDSSLVDYYYL